MKREVSKYRPRIKELRTNVSNKFLLLLSCFTLHSKKNPTILHMAHKSRLSVCLTGIFVFN